eukprot:3679099-Rhodomonas_salina.1
MRRSSHAVGREESEREGGRQEKESERERERKATGPRQREGEGGRKRARASERVSEAQVTPLLTPPVSYTHLTLPTICSV